MSIEPEAWSTAIEVSYYAADRMEASAFVDSMMVEALAGRVIHAWRRRTRGHRTPPWWMGQIYQRDDPSIQITGKRKFLRIGDNVILRRKPIPPGFFTTLRGRHVDG